MELNTGFFAICEDCKKRVQLTAAREPGKKKAEWVGLQGILCVGCQEIREEEQRVAAAQAAKDYSVAK